MPQPIPYLNFDGTCATAMRFYERALGGKLEVLMTAGESPMAEHFPPAARDRILHARLALPDGGVLMAGDHCSETPFPGIQGVSLALNFDTVAQAQRAFAALAEGGTVTMAMTPSFWAKQFGMVTDRFGTPWIVNGEMLPH